VNQIMMKGFLDELGKLKLAGKLPEGIIESLLRQPGRWINAKYQVDRGRGLQHGFNEAIEQGYPAGWVSLGMRPRVG